MIVRFALHHLWRRRRMNVVVLLVMALASALLAGLPTYATVIAARSLRASLAAASPVERNLTILSSQRYRPNAALLGDMLAPIEDLMMAQMEVRDLRLPTPALYGIEGGVNVEELHLWSFSRMPERVRLIEGELPDHWIPRTRTEELRPPKAEALVAWDVARQTGIQVGDVIPSSTGNVFFVVGIIQPVNPQADAWFDDLSMFELGIRALDINTDIGIVPLIIPTTSMKSYFDRHAAATRFMLDHTQITVRNVGDVEAVLDELHLFASQHNVSVTTGLDDLLARYQQQLAMARVTLLLLTAQAMAFTLYTLGLMARFLRERSANELGTLVGRGAGRGQVTGVFAVEALILGALAVAVGPPLVFYGARLLLPDADQVMVQGIPSDSWRLALIAVTFAWLVIVFSIYRASRHNLMDVQRATGRLSRFTGWQRAYADLFLLALGGLIYWQLTQSGGFLSRGLQGVGIADPILLLGPSLLLIAVAMLFLRVFPALLRGVAWLAQRMRGLLLSLGLARLARAPQSPSHVILLISLAAGLTLFAHTFGTSLAVRQAEMARYLAGADLRVSLADLTMDAVHETPGIDAVTPVLRADFHTYAAGMVDLVLVEGATFGDVARYPPGFTSLTIERMVRALHDVTEPGVVPAIFHRKALPANHGAGDTLTFSVSGVDVVMDVRGVIVNFPTTDRPFIVVDRDVLAQVVGIDELRSISDEEAWLAVTPEHFAAVRNDFLLSPRVIADAGTQLRTLQADALTQSAVGAFRLNALVLAVLSVITFFMVHYVAAQQRAYEFGILRAGGLSAGQLCALLVAEGALVMGLGLFAGTGIGYGLARVMMPTLSQVVSAPLGGAAVTRIVFDWQGVLSLYGLLTGGYVLAMAILLVILGRAGVHRALRIGDE